MTTCFESAKKSWERGIHVKKAAYTQATDADTWYALEDHNVAPENPWPFLVQEHGANPTAAASTILRASLLQGRMQWLHRHVAACLIPGSSRQFGRIGSKVRELFSSHVSFLPWQDLSLVLHHTKHCQTTCLTPEPDPHLRRCCKKGW